MESAILDATLEALEQSSESGIRIRDIAASVGCSVGILYHYYGGREGLVEAAWARQFDGALEEDLQLMGRAVDESRTAAEFVAKLKKLVRIGEGPDRAAIRKRRIGVLGAAWKRPALQKALGKLQAERTASIQEIVRKGQEKGIVDARVDAHALAVFMQGYMLGRVLADIDPTSALGEPGWSDVVLRALSGMLKRD